MRTGITRGLIAVMAMVLAACGGSADAGGQTVTTVTTSAQAEPATTPTATTGTGTGRYGAGAYGATTQTTPGAVPTGESVAVTLGATDLGDVLVDGDGFTLYLFTKDTQGQPSVCYDQCEAAWPPLLGTAQAGAGLDAALLGTAPRNDGTMQVTYNGWPLYYFAKDLEPGETEGQDVNGVWFVVDATGAAVGQS